MLWKTDPTFYPSPKLAMQAPVEKLAYVAALNANGGNQPDALVVVDVDRTSGKYGQIVGRVDMPNVGDELHHFGWNACSSALCPYAPHPHVERRYLIVPGLRSSRIHVIDTKENPKQPKIVKVIEPQDVAERTGYARRPTAMVPAESSPWIITTSSLWAAGRSIVVRNTLATTSRGTWDMTLP